MKCSICDNDNPADAQFCGGCGTSLSVSKGSGIETTSSAPRDKKFLSSQNPSGGSAGRTIGGVLIGLVFSFFYGLLPGFFILAALAGGSSSFLPGVSRMFDSSFGPMALMVISMVVGIFVFPFAGAIWFSKDKKEKKTRLVLTTLLTHTFIAYEYLGQQELADRDFAKAKELGYDP